MADDIHVVGVKPRLGSGRKWRVYFSRPVYLYVALYHGASGFWDAVTDDNEWLETDELGAFQWGLKVIEKHKEMCDAQNT